jgi:hypothetical protein
MNQSKIIDDIEFSVSPFMALEAIRLKASLVKTFGPAFGQMLGIFKNGILTSGDTADLKLDGDDVSKAIETLMSQLDEQSFENLIKRLFTNLTAKGKADNGQPYLRQFDDKHFKDSMNIVFTQRTFTIYPVMALVLQVNYPDFFEKTVRNIGARIKEMSTSGPESGNETAESKNSETSANSIQS